MFVNQNKLIALESIFYDKTDKKIFKLKKQKAMNSSRKNPLGTDDYNTSKTKDILSAF